MVQLTYEEVNEIYQSNGCKLLTKEYQNGNSKLEFTCPCGDNCIKTVEFFLNFISDCFGVSFVQNYVNIRCNNGLDTALIFAIRRECNRIKGVLGKYGAILIGDDNQRIIEWDFRHGLILRNIRVMDQT